MSPLAVGKAMLIAALGAGIFLAGPVAAHAVPSAHVGAAQAGPASAARPYDEVEWFTGHTYPDTSAGLAACQAEGLVYERGGSGVPNCWLGEPDAGLYGLFMVRTIR